VSPITSYEMFVAGAPLAVMSAYGRRRYAVELIRFADACPHVTTGRAAAVALVRDDESVLACLSCHARRANADDLLRRPACDACDTAGPVDFSAARVESERALATASGRTRFLTSYLIGGRVCAACRVRRPIEDTAPKGKGRHHGKRRAPA